MIKIQCKKGQIGGMHKALGFYKEITSNVALKTFMIFPEGQISQGMWVVLQDQKINSCLLRLFTPKGTLWTSRQVICYFSILVDGNTKVLEPGAQWNPNCRLWPRIGLSSVRDLWCWALLKHTGNEHFVKPKEGSFLNEAVPTLVWGRRTGLLFQEQARNMGKESHKPSVGKFRQMSKGWQNDG